MDGGGVDPNCVGTYDLCANVGGKDQCTKSCTYPGGGGPTKPDPTDCPNPPTNGTCTPRGFCAIGRGFSGPGFLHPARGPNRFCLTRSWAAGAACLAERPREKAPLRRRCECLRLLAVIARRAEAFLSRWRVPVASRSAGNSRCRTLT